MGFIFQVSNLLLDLQNPWGGSGKEEEMKTCQIYEKS